MTGLCVSTSTFSLCIRGRCGGRSVEDGEGSNRTGSGCRLHWYPEVDSEQWSGGANRQIDKADPTIPNGLLDAFWAWTF